MVFGTTVRVEEVNTDMMSKDCGDFVLYTSTKTKTQRLVSE